MSKYSFTRCWWVPHEVTVKSLEMTLSCMCPCFLHGRTYSRGISSIYLCSRIAWLSYSTQVTSMSVLKNKPNASASPFVILSDRVELRINAERGYTRARLPGDMIQILTLGPLTLVSYSTWSAFYSCGSCIRGLLFR